MKLNKINIINTRFGILSAFFKKEKIKAKFFLLCFVSMNSYADGNLTQNRRNSDSATFKIVTNIKYEGGYARYTLIDKPKPGANTCDIVSGGSSTSFAAQAPSNINTLMELAYDTGSFVDIGWDYYSDKWLITAIKVKK